MVCDCVPAASQPPKLSYVCAEVGGSEQGQLGSLCGFKSGEEKLFSKLVFKGEQFQAGRSV